MLKEKLWLKKRTSRGRNANGKSREVRGRTKISAKNLSREIYKNQRWYSHFLLKFVICALLGLIWIRVGFVVNLFGHSISIVPLGLIFGIIILALEKITKYRVIELIILLIFAIASFIWPIGIVI